MIYEVKINFIQSSEKIKFSLNCFQQKRVLSVYVFVFWDDEHRQPLCILSTIFFREFSKVQNILSFDSSDVSIFTNCRQELSIALILIFDSIFRAFRCLHNWLNFDSSAFKNLALSKVLSTANDMLSKMNFCVLKI